MKKTVLIAIIILLSFISNIFPQNIEIPSIGLKGIKIPVTSKGIPDSIQMMKVKFGNSEYQKVFNFHVVDGRIDTSITIDNTGDYSISNSTRKTIFGKIKIIPGWLSILPPLIAIILAIIFRQVIVSLLVGIYAGTIIIFDYNPLIGFLRITDTIILNSLVDTTHISIVLFTMLIGGVVGIISKNGGLNGLANIIVRYAKSSRSGMITSWLLGISIFFDDYANTLIVGKMMRPITDKLRISRAKLSYIVDSTSAPVASLFIISTWIGYEVGLIHDGLEIINLNLSAYDVFLQTIPFRFYPIASLIFVFLTSFMGRDFGPMYKAEINARNGDTLINPNSESLKIKEEEEIISNTSKAKWYNGAVPILFILLGTLLGLLYTGYNTLAATGSDDYSLRSIISNADSSKSLLWASFGAGIIAIIMSIGQRILTLTSAVEAWFKGLGSMLLAVLILVLAWSIGTVTNELKTADYLVNILYDVINPRFLPVLVFIICAVTSFATGTSWGIMAIVMPLAIPISHEISLASALNTEDYMLILLGVISSVLAGSVFGDHCSPISDTTIMSSMASSCDHIQHVNTQLPYAIVTAIVCMLLGDILTAYGLSPYLAIAAIAGVLYLILILFGKKVPDYIIKD